MLTWRRLSQRILLSCRSSFATLVLEEDEEEAAGESGESVSRAKEGLPKVDRTGRFCSPRAGYSTHGLVHDSDILWIHENMVGASYEGVQMQYMDCTPLSTFQLSPALCRWEAEVLSSPPKLEYSILILCFTRKLLLAVVDRWDNDVLVIEKVAPPNWKNAPAGKIIEFCILHLALSEITVLGTQHQIVINEAVDLAKRFCDGAAPRIINGCLRSFIKDFQGGHSAQTVESEKQVAVNA